MNCRLSKRTRNTVNWHQLNQRIYWDFEISKVDSWRVFLYTSKSLTTRTFQRYWKQNKELLTLCSVLCIIFSILRGYHQYWWGMNGFSHQFCISSTVLMVFINSTQYPPLYWWYSSTVLNILHTTDGIHQQYWKSSTVLTVSINSTEYPPQSWWYP